MANLKDYLLENLKSGLNFCKAMDRVSGDDQKAKMAEGYLFSTMLANMLVDKFLTLKTDEEKEQFFKELEQAIAEEDDFSIIKFGGSTPQA